MAAVQAMAAAGMPPALLIGHSLGGTAALEAAGELQEITAVATISAPADVEHVLKQFVPEDLKRIEADGEAEVQIAGRPFRSEEHTSELQSLMRISYAVFCLKQKTK